jgi:16S rRNA C967 or C1407 C5-methylase (RsmB/RsmF family)
MADAATTDHRAPIRDPEDALARYAPLIADWDAFVAAMLCKAPACLVANLNRIAPAALDELLRADGRTTKPVAWLPGAFRCAPEARPGLWWASQAGLFNVQEEASLLPVALLDPRPGERVLDLCAAPGGKTAQICMALGNRGTVVANDRDSRRLPGVRDKTKRLGLVNLSTNPTGRGRTGRVLARHRSTSSRSQRVRKACLPNHAMR